MIVSLILAMDEQGGIGLENRLPWHLSADLKRFKELTMGHYLIVGRKTYQSIGRPLPGRKMIAISRDSTFLPEGVQVVSSLAEALEVARQAGETEAFIGGGSQVFAQAIPLADRIYLTQVNARLPADTFCPPIDWSAWSPISQTFHPVDDENEYPSTFKMLERKASK